MVKTKKRYSNAQRKAYAMGYGAMRTRLGLPIYLGSKENASSFAAGEDAARKGKRFIRQ